MLQFFRETDEEMKIRKEEARNSLKKFDEKDLEINADDYFSLDLDFPKRPAWSYNISPRDLDLKEQKYFTVS